MGSDRASTIRRREAGIICALCGNLIPTPPAPPTRRGYCARERKCETCEPRPFIVTLHSMGVTGTRVDLSVTFQDRESGASIGPWLLLDALSQLDVILRWGRVPSTEVSNLHSALRCWGAGNTNLRLTSAERLGLAVRGRGCNWTGYELKKLREAGHMPDRAKFRQFPA